MTLVSGCSCCRSQNLSKALFVTFRLSALTLLSACVLLGISGCGLTNGRQHGLGPGVTSGVPPSSPPPFPSSATTATLSSAVNPTTDMVYVVDSGYPQTASSGAFYAISGSSNSVVTTLPGLASPVAVDVNSQTDTIYIANAASNTVSVISGASNTVIATVRVGNSPSAIAVNATTDMVYVDNFNDETVSVIDGATNAVTATIPVLTPGPDLIAVDPVLNKIFVGSNQGYAETVAVLAGASNTVSGYLTLNNSPQAIVSNPVSHTLIVESNQATTTGVTSSTQIALFDETTSTSSGTIAVPGFVNSAGLTVDSATSLVYAANNTTNELDVVDLSSVTATVPYAASGSTVGSVSVNTATNMIYAVYSMSGSSALNMQVVNGSANATVANIAIH